MQRWIRGLFAYAEKIQAYLDGMANNLTVCIMKEGKKIVEMIAFVLALALCDSSCNCGGSGCCRGKACRCNKENDKREKGEGLDDGEER